MLANILAGLFADKGTEVIDAGFNFVDELFTSKEEAGAQTITLAELKIAQDRDRAEQELAMKRFEQEADELVYEDRKGAREMQASTNSKIPGVLTIIFTIAYFVLTTLMMIIVLDKTDLPQFAVVFISTIFGAVNAIMVQIISFYFGSSKGGEDNVQKMVDNMNKS